MQHSCGHKADSMFSKETVRRMPRCITCIEAKQLKSELYTKLDHLARLYPNNPPDELAKLVRQGAALGDGIVSIRRCIENVDAMIADYVEEVDTWHSIIGD